MHDALEITFDQWWQRQAGGAGLRVGLSAWGPTRPGTSAHEPPPTASLSLRKTQVFADRYVPGVIEETRLIVPLRLGLDAADESERGRAWWRREDGNHTMNAHELATLAVLAVRQALHTPLSQAKPQPSFAVFSGWMLTALDADTGELVEAMRAIEPRVFWWWGLVLSRTKETTEAERAWMWQTGGPAGDGPPDAAITSLLRLMESDTSTPADRLGLCRRAQRLFDENRFRDFNLQTELDMARSAALVDLRYRAEALEALMSVKKRTVANPSGGLVRRVAKSAWLNWRAGGVLHTLGLSAALAAGVFGSATARVKLKHAWSIRRLRSRRPRLPRGVTIDVHHTDAPARRLALARLDRIGDLITMQPIVERVRQRFPDAAVDLYVTAGFESIAECLAPGVNGIGVDWKDADRFETQLGGFAKAEPYDLLIDLLETDVPREVRLCRAISAAAKVGFDSPARREAFSHRVPTPTRPMHLIDRTSLLLRTLGIPVPDDAGWRPRLSLPEAARDAARRQLHEALGDGPWVGLHIGAGWRFKQWYPASFAEVGRDLVKRYGAKVAVLGGPNESELAREVATGIGEGAAVLQPSLAELPGLCGACDLMLVNDSGPMHLAVALDTPTVVAWGPGDRTLFEPRSAPGCCVVVSQQPRCANCPQEVNAERCPMGHRYEEVPCLQDIPIDAVSRACSEALDQLTGRVADPLRVVTRSASS